MTPAEFFRAGIAATNALLPQDVPEGIRSADSRAADQRCFRSSSRGASPLDTLPAQEFFNLLLQPPMQGFFADPIYGGNRDKVAWKMIGFPGVIAIYSEHIKTYRNKRYDVEPKSIVDLS